ncbi:hypothetical protein SOP93_17375 [Peribacillus frigoritolerans]|uniref:hypothetical protein n=1 Tax=Peribacillus frigoritolerans TaxID=450367 RepID=UPI002B2479AE|nr:hypothetical protein [Peribacillus frigoritolerans]MEB2492935.1 hypothetical protein [Peribacillus frigoritolerans]
MVQRNFPKLTSGAQFTVDFKNDFMEQMKFILDELKVENTGMVLIYDEFGRFLQNVDNTNVHETMQDLQDLAELASSYPNLFHVILITHRNMRQYGLKFNEEVQNEFDRIEKRFKVYRVESDKATFVRISHDFLKSLNINREVNSKDLLLFEQNLRLFPLFTDLNQVELEKFIINGSFPIHPVSLYLLPYLSNVLAQNERTLFTFLESDEIGGLIRHIKKSKDWYKPYQLFDFFYNSIEADHISNDLFIYKKILSKFSLESEEIKLIKFITLWNIAEQNSEFNLSNELVSFAFNWKENKTKQVLEQLKNKKIIRFNSNRECWELFEGSSVDVKSVIKEKMKTSSISIEEKLNIYNQNLKKRHFLALEYNDEKSITRFATCTFVYSSQILSNNFNPEQLLKDKNSDVLIINILFEDNINLDHLLIKLKMFNNPRIYYCIPSFNNADELIHKSYIIDQFLKDKVFLQQDKPYLEKELQFLYEDTILEINKITQIYSLFSSETIWYYGQKQININNQAQLEKHLSSLMTDYFPATPEVRNDSFNKRNVHSTQRKAAITVIDHLLKHYKESNIGIKGHGPEYLIYATMIKNHDLNLIDLDNITDENLKLLRETLLEHLLNHPSDGLSSLVNIMLDKPFGIRKPLIPIYLVALLRDKWEKIIFYSKGIFVDSSKPENIYNMVVNNSNDFSYDFFVLDIAYENTLCILEELFKDRISEETLGQHRPVIVSNAMLKWLRNLPRISQITSKVSGESVTFRDLIRMSEVDPIKAINELYHFTKDKDINTFLNSLILELEEYNHNHETILIKIVIEKFNVNSYESLKNFAMQQSEILKKNNPIINVLTNANKENWVNRLCYSLVGVERVNWSDTTDEMFEIQLGNELNKIYKKEENYQDAITIQINGSTKVINKVELSEKANDIFTNTKRFIKNAGRTVPKSEIEYMLYKLFEEAVN